MLSEFQILVVLFVHFELYFLNFLFDKVKGTEVWLLLDFIYDAWYDFLFPMKLHTLYFFHIFTKIAENIIFDEVDFICSDLTDKISKILFSMRMANFFFQLFLDLHRNQRLLNNLNSLYMALRVLEFDFLYQIYELVLGIWMIQLIVNCRKHNTQQNDSPTKVRPNVDCLVVDLKKTFENLTIRVKVNSITRMKFVISHIFRSFMEVTYVRCMFFLANFNPILRHVVPFRGIISCFLTRLFLFHEVEIM